MSTPSKNNYLRYPLLLLVVVLFSFIIFSDTAIAQGVQEEAGDLETGSLDIEENPIYLRLVEIINFLSIGVGIVATISVAAAGIQYMTSRGNPAGTSAAVKRIVQAATAIFMYVFGWAILNWLIPGGVLN